MKNHWFQKHRGMPFPGDLFLSASRRRTKVNNAPALPGNGVGDEMDITWPEHMGEVSSSHEMETDMLEDSEPSVFPPIDLEQRFAGAGTLCIVIVDE